MNERIADLFEYGFIELCLFAGHLKLDMFAEPGTQIPHHAREAIEDEADREHSHAHDAFLEGAHLPLELSEPVFQIVIAVITNAGGELAEHRLSDDELTNRIDQFIQL